MVPSAAPVAPVALASGSVTVGALASVAAAVAPGAAGRPDPPGYPGAAPSAQDLSRRRSMASTMSGSCWVSLL